MSGSGKDVEIECKVIGDTPLALKIDDGKTQCWIPRSKISDECLDKGKVISIFIPEWLASEKGLI